MSKLIFVLAIVNHNGGINTDLIFHTQEECTRAAKTFTNMWHGVYATPAQIWAVCVAQKYSDALRVNTSYDYK